METMDVLHWLNQNHEVVTKNIFMGIIPTVLIPMTALTVLMSSLAAMIASWFGIKLKTEGPKQFLEVLLKKRVLLTMVFLNLLSWGIYKSYRYTQTLPSFIFTVKYNSKKNARSSSLHYDDEHFRKYNFFGNIKNPAHVFLEFEKIIKLPKGAFRSGLLGKESLFYGTDDGFIYEIDKNTLSIKRKFFVGTQVSTRPIIYKNRIFVGEGDHLTHHARIYSFDLQNGQFINSFQTKGHTEGQPVIKTFPQGDLMFLTAGKDGLYAINPLTMEQKWHQIDGHLDATVSEENEIIYAGTGVEKGTAHDKSFGIAYDAFTGKKIWKTELPFSNWMHPIPTLNFICYVLGEIYLPSRVGLFYCLDKKNGTPVFSIPIDSPLASKPFYLREKDKEFIYFSDMNGRIYGVDLLSKEKMWTQETQIKKNNHSFTSLDYDFNHGVLWYPAFDNGIWAISPLTGKVISHWAPEKNELKWNENYGAVNFDETNLYHLDILGYLRKFKIKIN